MAHAATSVVRSRNSRLQVARLGRSARAARRRRRGRGGRPRPSSSRCDAEPRRRPSVETWARPGPQRRGSRARSGVRTSTAAWAGSSRAAGPACTSRPRAMTTTSSTVCCTSPSTWLETRTVRPSAASARRNSRSQRDAGRVEPVGRLVEHQHPGVAEQRLRRGRAAAACRGSSRRPGGRRLRQPDDAASTSSTRRRGRPPAGRGTAGGRGPCGRGGSSAASSAAPTVRSGCSRSR